MPVPFDLRDAVLAPEFMDAFQVLRRDQEVNTFGHASNTTLATFPARGVVTAASPDGLERLPEDQRQGKAIEIITTFGLRGPAEGKSPDIVVWNGDNFVVVTLDDWSNYGPGFVHAVCSSQDAMDVPPAAPGVGQPAV